MNVGARQDEAALVARHDPIEPVRVRRRADEHEAGIDVKRLVPGGTGCLDPAQAAVLAGGRVYASAPDGTVFAVDASDPAAW